MAKAASAPSMDKQWQAESDLRCLIDAEKIKGDKKRYAAAMKCLAEQRKALDDVAEENDEEEAENV
jgi:hypothetical protein